jgi:hypothetical protein
MRKMKVGDVTPDALAKIRAWKADDVRDADCARQLGFTPKSLARVKAQGKVKGEGQLWDLYVALGGDYDETAVSHRPTEKTVTDELIARVSGCIRKGNFGSVAARRMGVTVKQHAYWLTKGRKDAADGTPSQCRKYAEAVDQADADAHAEILEDVLENGNPETKLKFLHLRYPREYNKNPRAHTNDDREQDAKDLLLEKLTAIKEIVDS